MASRTPLAVRALDGFELAADAFAPQGEVAAQVVIASATAVPRRLYFALAEYLAEGGLSVLTFDYRVVGGSRPSGGSLRGFRATAQDWGVHDLSGALRWAEARAAGKPVLLLGHSMGGQILGLAAGRERLAGAVLVASGSAYWRHWDWPRRAQMWLLFHALLPGMASLLGYLPMKRFAGGEDLPKGVALDWASWGRHPRYILRDEVARRERGHETLPVPLLAYAMSDDWYAPVRAVEALLELYPSAPRELRVLAPSDAGLRRIGHFGWARPSLKDALWAPVRRWMLERAAAAQPPSPGGADVAASGRCVQAQVATAASAARSTGSGEAGSSGGNSVPLVATLRK